jgi:hypothetical protein
MFSMAFSTFLQLVDWVRTAPTAISKGVSPGQPPQISVMFEKERYIPEDHPFFPFMCSFFPDPLPPFQAVTFRITT